MSKDVSLHVDSESQPEIAFPSNTANGVNLLVPIMFQYLTALPLIIDKHIAMSVLLEYKRQLSNMGQVGEGGGETTGWQRTLD